jgi:hypothetical protein
VDAGPGYTCVDGDSVESLFADCNLRRIAYTNGGGLESVELYYDATTGAWLGVRENIDGPDFCGHNGVAAGVAAVGSGCTLTRQRSLCGSGDAGDAGDGG